MWNGAQKDVTDGKIDEVRISDTALTPDQFLGNYAVADSDADSLPDAEAALLRCLDALSSGAPGGDAASAGTPTETGTGLTGHTPLSGTDVDVIGPPVLAPDDDEGLDRQGGRPFEDALQDARLPGSRQRAGDDERDEGEGGQGSLHGHRPPSGTAARRMPATQAWRPRPSRQRRQSASRRASSASSPRSTGR